jgi:signal transduction histidine kinase/ligand-binding sensor domain-containing protein
MAKARMKRAIWQWKPTLALITFGALNALVWSPPVLALNPSFDLSQYAHTAWKSGGDFPTGIISAIAQMPDGYLCLGTEFGPLRFDGVRTTPLNMPADQHLPSSRVRSLLVSRDGTLWIGTLKGLASWKNGKLTQYAQFAGDLVLTLLQDREGTIWAGGFAFTPPGKFCAIRDTGVQCYGDDGSLGNGVMGLYEDRKGNLWAGVRTGVWRWKPGVPQFYPLPGETYGIQGLAEDENGALLITMPRRVVRLLNGKVQTAYIYPGLASQSHARRLMRDRDGGLWIGTLDRGLLHVHQGRIDAFTSPDGFSGPDGVALYEDREGSVWVGTDTGLDRFRDFAVPTYSASQGFPSLPGAVVAARDGSVWVETHDGLARWNHGVVQKLTGNGFPHPELFSLFEDHTGRIWLAGFGVIGHVENERFVRVSSDLNGPAYSMAEDATGKLWIASLDEGLLQLDGDRISQRIPWARLKTNDYAISLAGDSSGGLWLGFYDGGLEYLKDGQVRGSYTSSVGLGQGTIFSLRLDREETLWAATLGGLSRLKNGSALTLTSKNGLPCDAVLWTTEDAAGSFWVGTTCGLVRIERRQMDAWVSDPKRTIQANIFDSSDGVPIEFAFGIGPNMAKSMDGKIWFATGDGVSMVDPRRLPFNKLRPPIHIEQIVADHKIVSNGRLPALTHDLEIDYTALSLVAPEKNRFKYKLEGYDGDWQDAGNRRQAFYTNLAPRSYRFRVAASNNSGVWNENGDSVEFSIAPAYYQTNWFRASCAAAFLALLWGLHRYRLHQIAREFNARLDERVNERTRIARDLHDTLLQSFQGLMLRFQVAHDELPARPAEARKTLENALDQAAQAITEGRDAVQGLRSSTVETNDLARAIGSLGAELAGGETDSNRVESFVDVEGTPRDIRPILRDEIYRIAGEALRNAFRHAQAKRIEVTIWYGVRQFRLRVRDDGKGIDPEVLDQQGRAGHWGLAGMRERAELIGGQLEIWSQQESGTQVELSIPASLAYGTAPARRFRWFAKKTGTNS